MTRYEIIAPPLEPEFETQVLSIIAGAYGVNYSQELAARLLSRAEGCVTLQSQLGVCAGLAIVSNRHRIMMSAATETKDRLQKIHDHREVLCVCHETELGTWMTIGEPHDKVRKLVSHIGMQRINDIDVCTELLEGLNENGPRFDRDDENCLVVVSQHDAVKPGYRQQIWGWTDTLSN